MKSNYFLLFALFAGTMLAGEHAVLRTLHRGPYPAAVPVGTAQTDTSGTITTLFTGLTPNDDRTYPAAETPGGNGTRRWNVLPAGTDSTFIIPHNTSRQYTWAVLYFYAATDRFSTVTFKVAATTPFRMYQGKTAVCGRTTATQGIPDPVLGELPMERGTTGISVYILLLPGESGTLKISAVTTAGVDFSVHPAFRQRITDVLDGEKASMALLSPDGKYSAIITSTYNYATSASDKTLLIIDNRSMACAASRSANQLSHVQWMPDGNTLLASTTNGDGSDVCLYQVPSMQETVIAGGIANLSSVEADPTGETILYGVTEGAKKDPGGLRLIDEPHDRLPWAGNKTSYYLLPIASGTASPIGDGTLFTDVQDISADGSLFLLSKTEYDALHRPYSFTSFLLWDKTTNRTDSIGRFAFANEGKFSRDSKSILFAGSPALFGRLGYAIDTAMQANDYEDELYLFAIATRKPVPLTKSFNPSVISFQWRSAEELLLTVTEGSYQPLYKLNTTSGRTEKIETGRLECVTSVSLSKDGNFALLTGSGATTPGSVVLLDLRTGKQITVYEPEKEFNTVLVRGECEPWRFTSSAGEVIDGYFYYPVPFDPNKKYPLIVSFYGGISPTERSYEGRYPKNYWAGNGYAVLVLQPSGAVGYGQRFAAKHVNDWGKTTAAEIIEGTLTFTRAHTWVDSSRIGCIGASYGGYMTMNVLTKTPLFRAAVSHAGISSLASYWGQGYWGYLYSSVATANSFPWNRKDIYVEESPIYNADKVTTPLLLLHGASDTNVPPGESRQFYIALKLLGKEAELIEVEGQDHHILEHDKRLLWSKTIMAWFDKHLKGETDWWNRLYPAKGR